MPDRHLVRLSGRLARRNFCFIVSLDGPIARTFPPLLPPFCADRCFPFGSDIGFLARVQNSLFAARNFAPTCRSWSLPLLPLTGRGFLIAFFYGVIGLLFCHPLPEGILLKALKDGEFKVPRRRHRNFAGDRFIAVRSNLDSFRIFLLSKPVENFP